MNLALNKLIVISGCSGCGKSTLLSELSNFGYTVIPEVGREIVKEQLTINGDLTPWQNPTLFCETAIARSIAAYHQANEKGVTKDQIIFFDRCFLDNVSYYQASKMADSNKYDHFINDLRFYPTGFMAPPWEEIFCQDANRQHSFEEGVQEYQRLLKFYVQSGYRMVELPKVGVKERVQFVISTISSEG